MIQVDTDNFGASYTGGTFSPTVFYENSTGCERPVCPAWITYEDIGAGQEGTTYVSSYRFTVAPNDGYPRYDRIQFQCTDTGGQTWVNYINVTQGCGLFVSFSIWKDTYYYAQNTSEFKYSIRTEGVDVYYGKAYCKPGDGGCYVQVNKICQNYLKNVLGDFREVYNRVIRNGLVVNNEGAVRDFSLCDEYGAEMMNYRFILDYAGDWTGYSPYVMSRPINGHLDPRMLVMHTEYNGNDTVVNYEIND